MPPAPTWARETDGCATDGRTSSIAGNSRFRGDLDLAEAGGFLWSETAEMRKAIAEAWGSTDNEP